MSDLEGRLSSGLGRFAETPLSEPEPLETLRKRARMHRVRRGLAGATAIVVAVAGLGGVLAATRGGEDPNDVQLLAPNILLGDIDAVVLSTTLDANGARAPIPSTVRESLDQLPEIAVASGIVQRFAPVFSEDGSFGSAPPRTPILFSYHEPSEITLASGALPAAPEEIVVNADLADRFDVAPGDTVALAFDRIYAQPEINSSGPLEVPEPQTRRITGIFDVPGIDTTGMPLAAIPATQPLDDGTFDRIDLALTPGADVAAAQTAVASILGDGYVVLTPTQLGLADQRTAELAIQHAYWSLLSADPQERFAAREPDGTTIEQMNDAYESYKTTADQAELRIQQVSFLSPDRATLVYRVYYGGSPSPILDQPQNGEAVLFEGKWRIAASTTCQLATYIARQCAAFESQPLRPPDGWSAAETQPQLVEAFRTLADPDTTFEARSAALGNEPALEQQVRDGLAADRKYSGRVRFFAIGVTVAGDQADVLYSLGTDAPGGPATPYPVPGSAHRVGDRWVADAHYACGLAGLASQGCYAEGVASLD